MNLANKKITVLVTEGENRSSLAVTRSLGRYGCNIIVTGEAKKNISSCSRFCNEGYRVPSPLFDGKAFIQAVQEIILEQKVDVLFPMTEPAIMLVAEHRRSFPEDLIIACPPVETVKKIFNKYEIFRMAQTLDVAIPKTIFVKNRQDFLSKNIKGFSYPVVVKPSMSRVPMGNRFLSTSVKYVKSSQELKKLYSDDETLDFPSMIQEKITGPGTGLFTLFEDGHHCALFSHKRLREKPPSGGVSVMCESVPLDDEMVLAAQKLLAAVDWNGVAMVEFKRDVRDGKAKLMEINGRFWGSLQLAIASGVDFPVLYLSHLMQEDVKNFNHNYKIGLKMRWFLGTLDHLLIRLRYSNKTLNLPLDAPTKLEIFYEFMRFFEKNRVYDVIDAKDLRPFWCELCAYCNNVLRGH